VQLGSKHTAPQMPQVESTHIPSFTHWLNHSSIQWVVVVETGCSKLLHVPVPSLPCPPLTPTQTTRSPSTFSWKRVAPHQCASYVVSDRWTHRLQHALSLPASSPAFLEMLWNDCMTLLQHFQRIKCGSARELRSQ